MAERKDQDPCLDHFREHREEIRTELLDSIARFAPGEWDGSPLRVRSGPFSIVVDVHADVAGFSSRVITRIRAPYVNRDGFRFRLRRRSLMLDLAKHLGMEDVEIGDPEFDREFIVQGNSKEELRRLLGCERLRRDLVEAPVELLEVRDDEGWFGPDFPGEVDELYLQADGRITEPDKIDRLYRPFAETLDRLCQIGSAYRSDPNVRL
ncbi:MAG: DUF3137 domain-containing protein [Acidobacteria bacterium]|nr:MAG: DUF3137 domain-containing protein [Acidobacteriota bacterium]